MPILKNKKTVPLTDRLYDAGDTLWGRSADKKNEAEHLAHLAAQAVADAEVAQRQAKAVDEALRILKDADVLI